MHWWRGWEALDQGSNPRGFKEGVVQKGNLSAPRDPPSVLPSQPHSIPEFFR